MDFHSRQLGVLVENTGIDEPSERRGYLEQRRDHLDFMRLDVPHIGTFQGTSMEGECSITLSQVSRASVEGSFDCRDIHQNVGTGATVAAAGTFSARS